MKGQEGRDPNGQKEEIRHAAVGPPGIYDIMGAYQFGILCLLGLRAKHYLLDIGCGNLRAGRLFIPYLRSGHYFGIEPIEQRVRLGIEHETGLDIVAKRQPSFGFTSGFDFAEQFPDQRFDFLIAQSVFTHIPASGVQLCLKQAAGVMHDQSIFVFTYRKGDEDYDGTGAYVAKVVPFKQSTIEEMCKAAGLAYIESTLGHPRQQTWAVAVKPGYVPKAKALMSRAFTMLKRNQRREEG